MATVEIRPDEISAILRKQLTGFEKEVDVYDVGTVLQVGDGIARVYGLSKVMMSELLEFPNGVMGVAMNLEEDNVGCICLARIRLLKRVILSAELEEFSLSRLVRNFWEEL